MRWAGPLREGAVWVGLAWVGQPGGAGLGQAGGEEGDELLARRRGSAL